MPIPQETRESALLKRVSQIASWVGVPVGLRDDLAQESWIMCAEYAARRGKQIEDLSNTEIRLRCFEARRKILPKHGEVSVDDMCPFSNSRELENGQNEQFAPMVAHQQDALEDIMQQEETRKQCANLEKLKWVLETHPTLKLTPTQFQLWEIYRGNPYGRWKAERARALGVTRQNVANIVRVVRKKAEAAADLIKLWDGEVLPFFEKYNTGWATVPVRRLVWDVLRPHAGVNIPVAMRRHFSALQMALFDQALQILEREEEHASIGVPPSGNKLSLAYNMLISAARIQGTSPVMSQRLEQKMTAPSHSWIIHRFVRRAGHLMSDKIREQHKEEMGEYIRSGSKEGLRFAQYAIAYYGGIRKGIFSSFFASDGLTRLPGIAYAPIISRLYLNTRIPYYTQSAVWDDINFLRIALMARHFPMTSENIPGSSRNALVTVCQKSLRSRDSFVVSEAEKLLHTLQSLPISARVDK